MPAASGSTSSRDLACAETRTRQHQVQLHVCFLVCAFISTWSANIVEFRTRKGCRWYFFCTQILLTQSCCCCCCSCCAVVAVVAVAVVWQTLLPLRAPPCSWRVYKTFVYWKFGKATRVQLTFSGPAQFSKVFNASYRICAGLKESPCWLVRNAGFHRNCSSVAPATRITVEILHEW